MEPITFLWSPWTLSAAVAAASASLMAFQYSPMRKARRAASYLATASIVGPSGVSDVA